MTTMRTDAVARWEHIREERAESFMPRLRPCPKCSAEIDVAKVALDGLLRCDQCGTTVKLARVPGTKSKRPVVRAAAESRSVRGRQLANGDDAKPKKPSKKRRRYKTPVIKDWDEGFDDVDSSSRSALSDAEKQVLADSSGLTDFEATASTVEKMAANDRAKVRDSGHSRETLVTDLSTTLVIPGLSGLSETKVGRAMKLVGIAAFALVALILIGVNLFL